MDYEKKYKEALERAREYHKVDYDNTLRLYAKGTMEYLFPELKESEDERIRKELLEHCKNQAKPYIQTGNKCPQIQSWIDWLEKQGQNPAWSEEDEEMLEDIRFNYEFNKSGMTEGLIEQYNKWFEKIKSLKPQSHWKPSEKQIKDFGGALLILKLQHYASSESLVSLYEQLKKL